MEEISFLFFENFDYNELFDNGTFEETSHFLKFIHLSSGPSTIEDFVTEIIYMNNGDKKEYKEEMVENIQKALPWIGKSW